MKRILIDNAIIVTDERSFKGFVVIEGQIIKQVSEGEPTDYLENSEIIDAKGNYLLPGVIDDQVHFREPGLTHKGEIFTESRAAVAGGITSFMEMPNTKPQTTTIDELNKKFELAASKSLANYSFYMGATNDNLDELKKVSPRDVCGVKVFMGSSTGNMLVDSKETLSAIFAEIQMLIATHCEDEATIKANIEKYKALVGEEIPVKYHPLIRDAEACYRSSSFAVELASKYNSRLHVLHISTAKEMSLFTNSIPLSDKKITSEVCVHHLWFSENDYEKYGNRIKWNPSIKSEQDRQTLVDALLHDKIDVIATDHAPHLWSEKEGSCLKAASGGPLVQHSLLVMLQMVKNGVLPIELMVRKMCHAPADLFRIDKRGYIREGYYADLVLVDVNQATKVTTENLLYKCGWSPFEGETFNATVLTTWVNGNPVYNNGMIDESFRGEALKFNN